MAARPGSAATAYMTRAEASTPCLTGAGPGGINGTRGKPALVGRIHEEWTDREQAEFELLMLAFRAGASGERHEGR